MTGPAWLIDSKRIATKIKNASDTVDPRKARWISNPTKACPSCNYVIDNSDVVQEWPGLPRGVKFDPSDQELLWHLIAKAGKGGTGPHPFINEFIPSVDENDGICYTHPQKLPGVKQDGSVSHFFHRTFKAYNSGTRKRRKIQQNDDKENTEGLAADVRWHKTGKTKPVMLDGEHVGCKKIMVLYNVMKKGGKPEKTNWVMHQYHLGMGEDEKDGEFVVSKVFFQQQQQQLKSCVNINDEGDELQLMKLDETLSEEGTTTIATTSVQVQPDVEYQASASASASASAICTTAPDSSICVPEHDANDKQQLRENVSTDQVTVHNEMVEDEGNVNQIPIQETVDEQDDNSHLTTEEDTKWWEGESQYLLDSQQLAEGLALCDEFLQSQSSCGGGGEETRRLKPCLLSEYARVGGVDDFKKDLEECQTLSLGHCVSEPNQQHATDGLLDTPPDMRLSQLDFGSQDTFLS